MKVTSKFSFRNVYLWLSFLLIILVLTIYFICRAIVLHTEFESNMYAAYGCLLVLILLSFAFYQLSKRVAQIVITADVISIKQAFKKDKIYRNDIETIDLFARKSLGFLSNRNKVNGISIQTKNKLVYFFADLYYQNIADIKNALYSNFNNYIDNKQSYISKNKSIAYSLENTEPKMFSGNYIISINGITILTSIVVCVLVFKNEASVPFKIVMSFFFLLLFVIPFAYQAYYFIIDGNMLIIKNQVWWWKKITYDLNKIQSVIIERSYRRSNSLGINTIDFLSNFFLAGSLRDKTWRQLIEEFKARGIEVRNEAYLYS